MIPLRAVGGNVLLRRVAMDVHRSGLVVYGGGNMTVLQAGEVVGLGGRWTQDSQWFPPMPTPKRSPLQDGSWDPDWKPPDLTDRTRPRPPSFNEGHAAWLETVRVGDLVIYIQSRIYDTFTWEGGDILVYPGNWLLGVAEGTSIADHPELRRYEKDEFNDPNPVTNPKGEAMQSRIQAMLERQRR